MKTTNSLFLLNLFVLLLLNHELSAQVTIGSGIPPISGVVLDLKERQSDINNANSNKGLIMPRVFLTVMNDLAPCVEYATPEVNLDYTGLLVYNTNKCIDYLGGGDGLFMWSGTSWVQLSNNTPASTVTTHKDQDGNPFTARHFKTPDGSIDAGIWMTENLRAKTFAQTGRTGIDKTIPVNMPPAPDLTATYSDPKWGYPSQSGSTSDLTTYNKNPSIGLLYNWAAATNNKGRGDAAGTNPNATPSGQATPGFGGDNARTQGICPNGWHLPSDTEWNLLEQVIATNPQPFSSYTSSESGWSNWVSTWATTIGTRPSTTGSSPAHGNAMKSPCQAVDYDGYDTYGQSLPPSKGGFAALLIGYAYTNAIDSYGFVAHFHSSTSAGTTSLINRTYFSLDAGVSRNSYSRGYSFSVRCVKD